MRIFLKNRSLSENLYYLFNILGILGILIVQVIAGAPILWVLPQFAIAALIITKTTMGIIHHLEIVELSKKRLEELESTIDLSKKTKSHLKLLENPEYS